MYRLDGYIKRVKCHNRRFRSEFNVAVALSKWREWMCVKHVRMSMQPVEPPGGGLWGRHVGPTLSVSGMSRVDVEGLLTLSDGGGQGQVGLHHPLLVVAVDDRLGGHGQRVALGHVLGQRGERLLGLRWAERHVQSVSDKMQWLGLF